MPYPVALGITLIVELPVMVLLAPLLLLSRRACLPWAASANLVSHPVLWFALLPVLRRTIGTGGAAVAGEVLVIAFEGAVLAVASQRSSTLASPSSAPPLGAQDTATTWTLALLVSMSSNLASVGAGLLW